MSRAPTEIAGRELSAERFVSEVVAGCRPVVLRGLIDDWPAVRAARDVAARAHRLPRGVRCRRAQSRFTSAILPLPASTTTARSCRASISSAVSWDLARPCRRSRRRRLPGRQIGVCRSTPCKECLPGFAADNLMPLLAPETLPRIWLGTPSNVSSHYDTFDNLACVIAGRRRFTLYEPELIGRLYVGPIDRTMAGPPVSLAASSAPDDQRFPLFREVRDQAWICELEAGDALYLPKLWWHQVESLAAFNGLVNYWWDAFAAGPDSPYTSLLLAMITIARTAARRAPGLEGVLRPLCFPHHGPPARAPAARRARCARAAQARTTTPISARGSCSCCAAVRRYIKSIS